LAGSIPNPANEIEAYRYKISRPRRLAPAAPAPGCTTTRTPYAYSYAWHAYADPADAAAATTTAADAAPAGSAARAASTAAAPVETTASPHGASAAAAASATSALGQLHAGEGIFFVVKKLEGREADVRELFFAERDHHARDKTPPLLNVTGRHGRGVRTSCC
jgi:hypothetical protein